jgi:hypothetical protein
MRSLSDSELIQLWEGGMRRHLLDRALLALSAALPETPYERLADWPLGRRNSGLAELRCSCFGPSITGWIACTSCGEKLEFALDGQLLTAADRTRDELSQCVQPEEPIVVKRGTFRLPTSRDLAKAVQARDSRLAAILIVESCLIEAQHDPEALAGHSASSTDGPRQEWSDEELEEIGERMALADPLAETRLTMHCPNCENDWQENLDIGAFLWGEIEARARRLLVEIHTLASAYGWTESEILSLGENRRARYVEMVQS